METVKMKKYKYFSKKNNTLEMIEKNLNRRSKIFL